MRLKESEAVDLGKLAVERVRKAFMSVGQLVDDDRQRATLLIAVAVDIVKGAADTMEEAENITEGHAMGLVVLKLLEGLGVETKNTVDGAVARFVK